MSKKNKQEQQIKSKFEDFDLEYIVFFANINRSDSSGHRVAGEFARALLDAKGLDYTQMEYSVGNYNGTGKSAILMNGQFVRYEDE